MTNRKELRSVEKPSETSATMDTFYHQCQFQISPMAVCGSRQVPAIIPIIQHIPGGAPDRLLDARDERFESYATSAPREPGGHKVKEFRNGPHAPDGGSMGVASGTDIDIDRELAGTDEAGECGCVDAVYCDGVTAVSVECRRGDGWKVIHERGVGSEEGVGDWRSSAADAAREAGAMLMLGLEPLKGRNGLDADYTIEGIRAVAEDGALRAEVGRVWARADAAALRAAPEEEQESSEQRKSAKHAADDRAGNGCAVADRTRELDDPEAVLDAEPDVPPDERGNDAVKVVAGIDEKVAEENVADVFGKDAEGIDDDKIEEEETTDNDVEVCDTGDDAGVELEEDPAEIVLEGPGELIDEEAVDRNTTYLEEEADAENTEADDDTEDESDIEPEAEPGEPDLQGPSVDPEGLLNPLRVEEGVLLAREKEDET
ncbi:predicted protein [Postia placenta Mad-698-R]|nr:predicted protein [Postia placenta Mad-698-R]